MKRRSFIFLRLAYAAFFLAAICGWLIASKKPAPVSAASPLRSIPVGMFEATIPNSGPAPNNAPLGMVWVPGGEFSMGAQDPHTAPENGHDAMADARPIHRVYVDGFWMDNTDVTNRQFAAFVRATDYVTVAERKPRTEDFPGVSPDKLVPGSLVFVPPSRPVSLDDYSQWWAYVPGANWRHPTGPKSSIRGHEHDPVVQVAYEDAVAYAKWAQKRLPTEAEWEFAARGGLSGKRYVWGDEMHPDGKWMANIHEGHFPDHDTATDGYGGIAPVARFPANGYGLYDMAGNVWQWTSDWYRPDYYLHLAATGKVARNPSGPAAPFDLDEPSAQKRVQRGGSFLCTAEYCTRYILGTRGKGEISSATSHVGFRCVKGRL
jgi:formylglycine-generating enzyme